MMNSIGVFNRTTPFVIILAATIMLLTVCDVKAQNTDTTSLRQHSPKTASLLSMALPGLGQVYNKKYLKVPVIYAALGTVTFFAYQNNHYYKEYKTAYKHRTDGDPSTTDKYQNYSEANLLQLKDYYRRNVELTIIIGVAIYILNIVDASVDAHLFDFDVSDQLSMRLAPTITTYPHTQIPGPGISISLNLK